MTPKLLNCPKCGGKAKTKRTIDVVETTNYIENITNYYTECSKCGWARRKRMDIPNRDMAVRDWNVCVKEELKNEKNKSQ